MEQPATAQDVGSLAGEGETAAREAADGGGADGQAAAAGSGSAGRVCTRGLCLSVSASGDADDGHGHEGAAEDGECSRMLQAAVRRHVAKGGAHHGETQVRDGLADGLTLGVRAR